jgi:hypothetical protein
MAPARAVAVRAGVATARWARRRVVARGVRTARLPSVVDRPVRPRSAPDRPMRFRLGPGRSVVGPGRFGPRAVPLSVRRVSIPPTRIRPVPGRWAAARPVRWVLLRSVRRLWMPPTPGRSVRPGAVRRWAPARRAGALPVRYARPVRQWSERPAAVAPRWLPRGPACRGAVPGRPARLRSVLGRWVRRVPTWRRRGPVSWLVVRLARRRPAQVSPGLTSRRRGRVRRVVVRFARPVRLRSVGLTPRRRGRVR